MKEYLQGWSKAHARLFATGVALVAVGVATVAFAQSPSPPPRPSASSDVPAPPPPSPGIRPVMLTDQDIQIIVAMSEECVKAKGFLCAEAALSIKKKLEDSARPTPPPPPPASPPK